MTSQARITEQATQFIAFPLGIFLGGLTMLVTGFLELYRKNSLGATAFTVYGKPLFYNANFCDVLRYFFAAELIPAFLAFLFLYSGSFWLTVGVYGTIRAAGIFFVEAPEGEQALVVLMGFASLVFMVVSLAANLALPFLFLNLTIMFFLLAGGIKDTTTARVAGWWGLWVSLLALYNGVAVLFKDMWGMDILPQKFTKIYEKTSGVWFPRCRVDPETGDIEDGDVKKGRVE